MLQLAIKYTYVNTLLKQEAHLRWNRDGSPVNWEEFDRCQVRANVTYSEAKRQLCVRKRAVLMNLSSPLI